MCALVGTHHTLNFFNGAHHREKNRNLAIFIEVLIGKIIGAYGNTHYSLIFFIGNIVGKYREYTIDGGFNGDNHRKIRGDTL